ncbi:MAG: alanine racemase [Spirochaetaceae bacterium]|nr:alanine racemase [Spirochaetaceae bacterium]
MPWFTASGGTARSSLIAITRRLDIENSWFDNENMSATGRMTRLNGLKNSINVNETVRPTRAVIHLDRLKANINAVREHLGKRAKPMICMPVKADAYGHGAARVAEEAVKNGVDYLAVATADEGVELRNAGIQSPVLLFSQPVKEELAAAARARLVPFIGDIETAELFAAEAEKAIKNENSGAKRLKAFLKIDTGMGRMGCRPEEAPALAAYIAGNPTLEYAGTATHLAVSDSPETAAAEYTRLQIERFKAALEGIRGRGVGTGIVTAANTGAVVSYPEAWFDMVRPGILLYGYPPDGAEQRLPVRPVMELKTVIAAIKLIRRGESVSYGRTWTARQDTAVGLLPVGYGDGLPLRLSGNFSVMAGGKSYPAVGRICMDQCMVDLGASPETERFAAVSVFGGGMEGALDAADIARRIGTIPYEITCGISKRVPRIYSE